MLHDETSRRRLATLEQYDLLGTAPERTYDQFAELAARLFGADMSFLSVLGGTEQWFKARVGIDLCGSDRDASFCAHTLDRREPLVVLDAGADPRFRDSPLVTGGPRIRFYAGAPVINPEGVHLGALCVADCRPRAGFDAASRGLLTMLAELVAARLEKRRATRTGRAVGGFAGATELAILTADTEGRITFWNAAAERMFGYPAAEAIGASVQIIVPPRFRHEHAAGLARATRSGHPPFARRPVEVVALRRDGSEFPIELCLASWEGATGREFGAHIQDITERRARDERLRHMAHHDALTGLLNRVGFDQAAGEARGALLALDLDGFKAVNDTLGHAVGDALLQLVALRLEAASGPDQLVVRVGGDEFAVLLPGCGRVEEARAAAGRLLAGFAAPFEVDGHLVKIAASIGLALSAGGMGGTEELLARADLALIAAKRSGGGLRLFTPLMERERVAARAFKEELRLALPHGQWELFYQPQVRLADGALTGMEALLRWRHPTRGLLAPTAFLPALDTHLSSYEVGSWAIGEACRQLAEWRVKGWQVPRVAVNLFASQVRAGTLATVVADALHRAALHPSDLELEITETIALDQGGDVLDMLGRLRDTGVHISFDDFGTGFASLSTLKRFPITRLKIDRSFVQDLGDEPHSTAIVAAVVSIGRSLDLQVVAEGVETERQGRELMRLGCTEGQGYLFGRPCPARELPRLRCVAPLDGGTCVPAGQLAGTRAR